MGRETASRAPPQFSTSYNVSHCAQTCQQFHIWFLSLYLYISIIYSPGAFYQTFFSVDILLNSMLARSILSNNCFPKLSSLNTLGANIIFFTFLTKQSIYSVQLCLLSFISFSPVLISAKATPRTSPLRPNSLSPLPQFLHLIDRLTNVLFPQLLISLCPSCTAPQETVIGRNEIRREWEDGGVHKTLVNKFVTDHSQDTTCIVFCGAKRSYSHNPSPSSIDTTPLLHPRYKNMLNIYSDHLLTTTSGILTSIF